jgi:hypothetical protein
MKMNGQQTDIDTIAVFEKVELSTAGADSIFMFYPFYYYYNYQLGATYFAGNNPNDTTPGFINISDGPNREVVLPRHLQIRVLSDFQPAKTAIINERFKHLLNNYQNGLDTAGSIFLTAYKPNKLTFKSNTRRDQLTVFSDIYYEKGWNAYVDNKPAPHFPVNYILRGMILPSGTHTIEFRFEPESYYTGQKIGFASSIIMLIILIGAGFIEFRKERKKES